MEQAALLGLVELPETFGFLHPGWFLVHVVAIAVVFYIGFLVGKKKARPS
jgi:hypothetical protein